MRLGRMAACLTHSSFGINIDNDSNFRIVNTEIRICVIKISVGTKTRMIQATVCKTSNVRYTNHPGTQDDRDICPCTSWLGSPLFPEET